MKGKPAHLFDPALWMERAACKGQDPDGRVFHPKRGDDTGPAKRICFRCPVKDECLVYALIHSQRHGVWGGTSERERRRMRKLLRRRYGLAYNYPLERVLTPELVAQMRDEVRGYGPRRRAS